MAQPKTTPTPAQAVVRGHLGVNLPTVVIIGLCGVVGWIIFETSDAFVAGLAIGAVVAWPWWSFMVARWRDWVVDRGLKPEDVHGIAVRSGLIWPRGWLPERTEFRRRNGKRGW